MAEKKPASRTSKPSEGFTDEERAAMQERARELKAAARRSAGNGTHRSPRPASSVSGVRRAAASRINAGRSQRDIMDSAAWTWSGCRQSHS